MKGWIRYHRLRTPALCHHELWCHKLLPVYLLSCNFISGLCDWNKRDVYFMTDNCAAIDSERLNQQIRSNNETHKWERGWLVFVQVMKVLRSLAGYCNWCSRPPGGINLLSSSDLNPNVFHGWNWHWDILVFQINMPHNFTILVIL